MPGRGRERRRPGPAAAAARRTAAGTAAARGRPARRRRATSGTRSTIDSRGQPRFSSPNATSSSTRSMTSCDAGSWNTDPDARPSTAQRCPRQRSPGMSRGIRPAIASASVLLPDPDGPTTSRHAPAGRSKETSRKRRPSRAVGTQNPRSPRPDRGRAPQVERRRGVSPGTRPARRCVAAIGQQDGPAGGHDGRRDDHRDRPKELDRLVRRGVVDDPVVDEGGQRRWRTAARTSVRRRRTGTG